MSITVSMLTPYISRRAGGLMDCVLNLSHSLEKEHDTQVEVLAVDDEFAALDRPLWNSLSVHLARPKIAGFRYAPELFRDLLRVKPDLVHTHGLWTYLSVATRRWSMQRASKGRYIVSPHGMLDPWALQNSAWKKRLALLLFERRHLEGAACLHVGNLAEAAVIRNFGLNNPICVIPNGVEISDATTEVVQPPWEDEFVDGRKVLLYLGRLHPKKGLPTFLRAWQNSISKTLDWVLLIAGWDQASHRGELEKIVDQLGLSKSVQFLGPLFGSRREAAYNYADAFVLPSLSEGQPLAVLEAWSHALPVLMTTECNLVEGFETGAAIRMDPTIESESQALEALFSLSDIALREMGARGRNLVTRNFSWSQSASEMFAVYQWLLGNGPIPPSVMID